MATAAVPNELGSVGPRPPFAAASGRHNKPKRTDGTQLPVRDYSREFAAQRKAAGLKAIPLSKLRHSNISRMGAAGIAADVVAAWHGHAERMTPAVYGRVTDGRMTAASAVFSAGVIGQS